MYIQLHLFLRNLKFTVICSSLNFFHEILGKHTVKPEFLASTNFRQKTVKEHSRCLFFASV